MEIYVDDDAKLTLHGLKQHYVKLKDNEKNRKLFELLDVLQFNQVCLCGEKEKQNEQKTNKILKNLLQNCTGGDLRQLCGALQGAVQAARGPELPRHCHAPRHEAGGAVSAMK